MTDASDDRLLEQFTQNSSEDAFAALVQRHIGLVYSVALRHTANPQHAEDITQAVFVILARKAGTLGRKTVLPGWLYHTARLTAANLQRAETRRVRREQEAYMQSGLEAPSTDDLWRDLSPQLDQAMSGLGAVERDALVLRYFQNQPLARVGQSLGVTENAAQKRVHQALAKLRAYFLKQGVSATTETIAGAISANSIQAAPALLAEAATTVALTKGATASVSTLTLVKGALKIMAWTNAKTAMALGTAIILTTATAVVVAQKISAPDGSASDRAPVVLRTQWQVGKKYVMHKENVQTMETPMGSPGKAVKQYVKLTQDIAYLPIKQLDNGGWQLQMEFGRLAVEVTNGNSEAFAATSTQPPEQDTQNPVGARLRKMIGARLEYFTDANGRVEKMNGYPDLLNRVAGTNQQEQAAFKDLFSESILERSGSIGEDSESHRVVKLGDHWEIKLKIPSNAGDLDLAVQCAFQNWEPHADRKCAHVTYTSTISTVADADILPGREKIENGRVSGNIWFDAAAAVLVESVSVVTGKLIINNDGKIFTSPFNEESSIALVDVEDADATNGVAAADMLLITPHVSAGKVKAGMTEDEVIAALGQPERKQGEVLIYDTQFGMSVVCSRQKIVGAVFCGGPVDFKGHTKEGIGIGSDKGDLIKAFGQPADDQTNTQNTLLNEEKLDFTPLGLAFTLHDGKVYHIIVNLRKQQ